MKLSKFRRISPFVVALVILAFIAGCTAKTEKPVAQKKPTDNAKFQRYAQVAWELDGKGILTLERYGETKQPATYTFGVYYQKTDMSERELLRGGLSRLITERIAVSPDGRYLMYDYARGPVFLSALKNKGQEVFLEIFDVKTNKVVTKVQASVTDGFGWMDNTTAWFTKSGVTSVTYTVQAGSSHIVQLVKGAATEWSSDKRYFLYTISTTDHNLRTISNLYLLDTITKTSSELLKSSDSATGERANNLVIAGNKLYYVRNHADTESFDISVFDLKTKKERVLWSMANPAGPDIIDRSTTPPIPIEFHSINVGRMFLDRSKRFLVFTVGMGEPQVSVFKLAVDGKSQAQSIASMQLAAGNEVFTFDYSVANNTLLWIDNGKTIKTKKLK